MNASDVIKSEKIFYGEDSSESPIHLIYNANISQKTTIETDFILQIMNIKELNKIQYMQENSKNNHMLFLTLSDQQYFYNGFILILDKNSMDLNNFDIIRVNSLTIIASKGKQKLFVIKKYNIVGNRDALTGNPKNVTLLSNIEVNEVDPQEVENSNCKI